LHSIVHFLARGFVALDHTGSGLRRAGADSIWTSSGFDEHDNASTTDELSARLAADVRR